MDGRYCVIDFETTGLSPAGSEIIEFAAVRVEYGEPGLNLSSLCRPHGPISAQITAITGITWEMTAGYPHFEELLPLLLDFIGKDVVAAHNIGFDKGFLDAYCRRAGIEFAPPAVCTLALARRLLPELENHKLGTVAARLGIQNSSAHRALGDAMTTAKALIKLLELDELKRRDTYGGRIT
ncbi:MAG: 3'-5' exonuclease [Oscillospiraceae bacterium]|nr:3'-5' exonuclease [Oscillospiraceae bacterium]